MIHELELSLGYYTFQRHLGLGAFWHGVDFSRSIEYPLVASRLKVQAGDHVLEVAGGNSTFGLYLASRNPRARFTVTDVEEGALAMIEDYLPKLGFKNIELRLEDATSLKFADGIFDRVVAVSAIEHIPDEGDIKAAAEIGRVLKPGGAAIITVPYAPAYRMESEGRFGYIRHYDAEAVEERIIEKSGLSVAERLYFNDEFSVGERIAYRPLPAAGARIRDRVFRHISPLIGPLLVRLQEDPPVRDSGTLLVLRK